MKSRITSLQELKLHQKDMCTDKDCNLIHQMKLEDFKKINKDIKEQHTTEILKLRNEVMEFRKE